MFSTRLLSVACGNDNGVNGSSYGSQGGQNGPSLLDEKAMNSRLESISEYLDEGDAEGLAVLCSSRGDEKLKDHDVTKLPLSLGIDMQLVGVHHDISVLYDRGKVNDYAEGSTVAELEDYCGQMGRTDMSISNVQAKGNGVMMMCLGNMNGSGMGQGGKDVPEGQDEEVIDRVSAETAGYSGESDAEWLAVSYGLFCDVELKKNSDGVTQLMPCLGIGVQLECALYESSVMGQGSKGLPGDQDEQAISGALEGVSVTCGCDAEQQVVLYPVYRDKRSKKEGVYDEVVSVEVLENINPGFILDCDRAKSLGFVVSHVNSATCDECSSDKDEADDDMPVWQVLSLNYKVTKQMFFNYQ